MNGLNINEKEFNSLSSKKQMAVIYQNTEELKSMVSNYKFYQKVQYWWLSVLTITIGGARYLGFI